MRWRTATFPEGHVPTPTFPIAGSPQDAAHVSETSASPCDPASLERLVRVYDRAIGACNAFLPCEASAALRLLRSALELDTPDARVFDSLYQWCEGAIAERNFVGAANCLRSLREAWCRAAGTACYADFGGHGIRVRTDLPVS